MPIENTDWSMGWFRCQENVASISFNAVPGLRPTSRISPDPASQCPQNTHRISKIRGSRFRERNPGPFAHGPTRSPTTVPIDQIVEPEPTWLTQYELSTLKLPHLRPTRSSATLWSDLWNLSWLIPWEPGLP